MRASVLVLALTFATPAGAQETLPHWNSVTIGGVRVMSPKPAPKPPAPVIVQAPPPPPTTIIINQAPRRPDPVYVPVPSYGPAPVYLQNPGHRPSNRPLWVRRPAGSKV